MSILALWTLVAMDAAHADAGAPADEPTEMTLGQAKAERKAARKAYVGTDWNYELALADDRDAVLAQKQAAYDRLKAARAAVKAARR